MNRATTKLAAVPATLTVLLAAGLLTLGMATHAAAAPRLSTGVSTATPASDDEYPDPGEDDAVYHPTNPASVGGGHGSENPEAATARALRCAKAAKAAAFTGEHRVMAVAVALAESGCNPTAKGKNGPTAGCPRGSLDRGAWQINNCYHKEVSDACSYNIDCNARAAYRISNSGKSWSPWSTFKNGAYKKYLAEARAGVNAT